VKIDEVTDVLVGLGGRLRAARIARNDTMEIFAERLGVSVGTVRAMKRGAPTVQIGAWLNALWIFDELETVTPILQRKESLLDRFRAQEKNRRHRASKRRK